MTAKVNRLWRTVATWGCALCIWGGGLVLGCTWIPLRSRLIRDQHARQMAVRQTLAYWFGFMLRLGQGLGIARLHWSDHQRLNGFQGMIIANHPTLIDTMVLMATKPTVGCIIKQSLWHSPFMRWPVRAAGYIPNHRDPETFITTCAERLQSGGSLLIFPEGTRSPIGQLRDFQRGAAHIALLAGCQVLPVVITCNPPALSKEHPWYHAPARPFHLTLRVGEPLDPRQLVDDEQNRNLAARQLTRYLNTYFEEQLNHGATRG